MTTTTLAPFIDSDPRILSGYPVIAGTMLLADIVGELHHRGVSRESLIQLYHLAPCQVDAAITFYAGMQWQKRERKHRRATLEKWIAAPREETTDGR